MDVRGIRIGFWLLVALVLLIAAGWFGSPTLITWRLERELARFGFRDARVQGLSLMGSGARVDSLWLDAEGANRLADIGVRATMGGLLAARIESIQIGSATLRVVLEGTGASVAGVLLGAGGGGTALPVGHIGVRSLELRVEGAIGDILLPGPLDLRFADVGIESGTDGIVAGGGFNAEVSEPAPAFVRGRFEAVAADTLSLAAELDGGRFAGFGAAIEGLGGWLVVAAGQGRPEFAGELAAERVVLADLMFSPASLLVDGDPSALTVIARATGPAGALAEVDARLDFDGQIAGTASADLSIPDLARAGSAVEGALLARLTGRLSLAPGARLPSFKGEANVTLADVGFPGFAEGIDAAFVGAIDADPDAARIVLGGGEGTAELRAEGRWIGPVPAPLTPLVDGTIALEGRTPLTLVMIEGDVTITGGAELNVDAADGQRLELRLGHLAATIDDGKTPRIEALDYAVSLPGFVLGPVVIRSAQAKGGVTGSPEAWSGTIEGRVEGGIEGEASPIVPAASVDVRARFATKGASAELVPTDCFTFRVARLETEQAVIAPTNTICVMSLPDTPFAAFDPATGTSIGFRVLPFLAEVTPIRSGRLPEIALTSPRARIRLSLDPDGALSTVAGVLAGGSVTIPAHAVAFSLVEAGFDGRHGEPVAFRLRGDVKHLGEPTFVVPLGLTTEGTFMPGDRLEAQGVLRGGNGALALDVTLAHDLGAGDGNARVTLHPLSLVAGVRDAADLFPVLSGTIEDASGSIEAKARIAWSADTEPDGTAEVALRGLKATAFGATAEAINGVITFDHLLPPSLPPGQSLGIGLLDVGVPLVNGLLVFGLDRDRRVTLEKAEWQWAGGLIFAEPFSADLDDKEWRATLGVRDLDLGRLLAIADVDGLDGTGTLAGRLPLRLGFATIAVENGALSTTGPGTLRYRPISGPPVLDAGQAGTALLLDALKNFQYDELAAAVNGVAGGETMVRLRLEGRNPDLYDGYPVALNVNLSGALDTLLRRGLAGYRIPDALRQRLETFGGEGP
jgi:hypothetical protein